MTLVSVILEKLHGFSGPWMKVPASRKEGGLWGFCTERSTSPRGFDFRLNSPPGGSGGEYTGRATRCVDACGLLSWAVRVSEDPGAAGCADGGRETPPLKYMSQV